MNSQQLKLILELKKLNLEMQRYFNAVNEVATLVKQGTDNEHS